MQAELVLLKAAVAAAELVKLATPMQVKAQAAMEFLLILLGVLPQVRDKTLAAHIGSQAAVAAMAMIPSLAQVEMAAVELDLVLVVQQVQLTQAAAQVHLKMEAVAQRAVLA